MSYRYPNRLRSDLFTLRLARATRAMLVHWTPSAGNEFFFRAHLIDGRSVSFCARNHGDPRDRSYIRTTVHVRDSLGETYVLRPGIIATRLLILAALAYVAPETAAGRGLSPIIQCPRRHRHRWSDAHSQFVDTARGTFQLTSQSCQCGREREVTRRCTRLGRRTISIDHNSRQLAS
jgi:hypothetical protein